MNALAYCALPHDNGVFAFYRALRVALAPHGIQAYCVSVGAAERERWDPRFVDEGCVAVDAPSDPAGAARAFADWCEQEGVDIVFPQHSTTVLSVLPHLASNVRVVHACMDLFPEALALYREIAPHCDRVVAATPRQRWELSRRSISEEKLRQIPFCARTDEFSLPPAAAPQPGQPLRLCWVARLNHLQKGVNWLVPTLRHLDRLGVQWTLDVAGQGTAETALRRAVQGLPRSSRVLLHGRLVHTEIAELLSRSHVYLLPTRYEGFGISIVEAMAAGAAPVVSKIPGVTDYIIEHEQSGLLSPLGSPAGYAAAIARCARDPELLARLRAGARKAALARFSLEPFGRAYAELLQQDLPAVSPRVPRPWGSYVPRSATYKPWWVHRVVPGRLVRHALDLRERCMSQRPPSGMGAPPGTR